MNVDALLENESEHEERYDAQGNLVCEKCGIIMKKREPKGK